MSSNNGLETARGLGLTEEMTVEDLWNLYYEFDLAVVINDGVVVDFVEEP